jgi:hypothetical protein
MWRWTGQIIGAAFLGFSRCSSDTFLDIRKAGCICCRVLFLGGIAVRR